MKFLIIPFLWIGTAAFSQTGTVWMSKQYIIEQNKRKNSLWIYPLQPKTKGKKLKTCESILIYSKGTFLEGKREKKKCVLDSKGNIRNVVRTETYRDRVVLITDELDERGIEVESSTLENGNPRYAKKVFFYSDSSIREIQEYDNGKLLVTEKYQYKNEKQFEIERITDGRYEKEIVDLNGKGKGVKSTMLDTDNVIKAYYINEYDPNGNHVYWKKVVNNAIDGETRWKYDSLNRVIEQIDYLKSEDNYTNHELFKYDPSGEINYHKRQDKWGDAELYESVIVKDTIITTFRRRNNIESINRAIYLSKNRPLYVRTDTGNRSSETIYTYDANGFITSQKILTDGKIVEEKKYQRIYDDGLIMQEIEYHNGKEYIVQNFKYTFF